MPFCFANCHSAVCKCKSDLCMRQLHTGIGSSNQIDRRLWLILGFVPEGLGCWKLIWSHPSRSALYWSEQKVTQWVQSVPGYFYCATVEGPGSLVLTSKSHRWLYFHVLWVWAQNLNKWVKLCPTCTIACWIYALKPTIFIWIKWNEWVRGGVISLLMSERESAAGFVYLFCAKLVLEAFQLFQYWYIYIENQYFWQHCT